MAVNCDLQIMFKNQFETLALLGGKLAANAGKILIEAQDLTINSMEAQAAFLRKLASARNASDAIQIQSDYAHAAFASSLERSKKISDLLAGLSQETVKSVTVGAEPTKVPEQPIMAAKKLHAA
jgi:hypothetical protein